MAEASQRILPPHTPVHSQTVLLLPWTSTVCLGAGAQPCSPSGSSSLGSRRRLGSQFHRWAAGLETD